MESKFNHAEVLLPAYFKSNFRISTLPLSVVSKKSCLCKLVDKDKVEFIKTNYTARLLSRQNALGVNIINL